MHHHRRAGERQVAAHRARLAAGVWDAAAWQALAADVSAAVGPGRPPPDVLALYRSVMEQLLAQFPTAVRPSAPAWPGRRRCSSLCGP